MKRSWRWWRTAVYLALVLLLNVGTTTLQAQDEPSSPASRLATAQTLLENMTPAERVGQLFLVTFEGDRATLESDIADLITNFHVGGVVLSAENDNITGYGDPNNITGQTAELIRSLQSLALRGLPLPEIDATDVEDGNLPPTLEPPDPFTPIPLFIAVAHEGDSYPNSTILSGLTDVPSNMAIGATWRPDLAQQVGQVVGEELAGLGINMLFGPSLDVVEAPDPFSASDLGVRSFGGDPYWVGVLGSAYTTGVHLGSNNQVAVIPKHFPGYGASDRPLHEDVPTVRKSLEQLRQIELAPFFAVTGDAASPEAVADGLLTTHIRYQGFQGNIRATTNPVSLDPIALSALMAQEELSSWRAAGGLIVSDKLGVRAVERFYGQDQGFPHRVVAKDAFLAGNDLLYLADFALGDAPYADQLVNIIDTILWFQDRYTTDVAFQQQVDTAVLRILQLKLKLHNDNFAAESLLANDPLADTDAHSNNGQATIIDVAQSSLTLIAPDPDELSERLVQPPTASENILIFTDLRQFQQCSFCEPQPLIGLTAIEERMLTLYGPQASEQLQPE
ncbi:MAG: glycoside hydrolase family 3 N-terminal domain-containing protein, partial [Chloroflexota bacterium]